MVVALHRYESINDQMEAEKLPVRYGPPVVGETVQTEDVHLHASTGIYIPTELWPIDVPLPASTLEDALSTLYTARGIERQKPAAKEGKTSAERTCG